jgi:hypothetical protein
MPTRQRGSVADIGDRLATKLGRSRHAPARHDQFALTLRAVARDRRKLVGKILGNDSPPNPRFDPPQAIAARFWRTRNQQLEYNPRDLFCPLI